MAAAAASFLQKRQEGAVGREMASTGNNLLRNTWKCQSAGASQSPPPVWQAARARSQPAAAAARVPGLLEKYTCCAGGNPPLLPRLFRQTYLSLKQGAHCYRNHETLTSVSGLFSPRRPLTMVVLAGHTGKRKRANKQFPGPFSFVGPNGTKHPNRANKIQMSQKINKK